MQKSTSATLSLLACLLLLAGRPTVGQREGEDDFDDAGFDDSGYNQPQNHDAEGSNQNPSNYSPSSEEDLDDDDDVDESHVSPQVATGQEDEQSGASERAGQPARQQVIYRQEQLAYQQPGYFANLPAQRFYSAPNSLVLGNVEPLVGQHFRYRRSAPSEPEESLESLQEKPLLRQRRHSKYIGPVYTYVKTDKHAHYKWGVKHKVGKKGKHYGR